jgi:transcriptional regulator with XRE-family HTH domain
LLGIDTEESARDQRRKELAAFLRQRRESMDPAALGLPYRRRRRTPGLRREDVADRAGIGVGWYARLEMAHDVHPSAETLLAVAGALSLRALEVDYIFKLADLGPMAPAEADGDAIPDALRLLVRQALPALVSVADRYGTIVDYNAIADSSLGFSSIEDPVERNFVVYMLNNPRARSWFGGDFGAVFRRAVGVFRRAYVTGKPTERARRIYEAVQHNDLFLQCWRDHVLADRTSLDGPVHRLHPTAGELTVTELTLRVPEPVELLVQIGLAADEQSGKKLASLVPS